MIFATEIRQDEKLNGLVRIEMVEENDKVTDVVTIRQGKNTITVQRYELLRVLEIIGFKPYNAELSSSKY